MRVRTFVALIAIACAIAALITSCGSTSTAGSAHGAPSPATTALNAPTFTTRVTDGWRDLTTDPAAIDRVQATGAVLLLLEAPPPSPVVSGVNDVSPDIIVAELPQFLPNMQFAGYLRSVSTHGAGDVSAVMSVSVGGATGSFITYAHSSQTTPLESEDVVVDDNGVTYEITLNTSRDAFSSQRAALNTMLTSWHWSTGV